MRLRLCLPLLVSLLLVAACGATTPPTATPVPTSIRFVYEYGSLASHYEKLAADFEAANPGVDVVVAQANPYNALQPGSTAADAVDIDQLSIAALGGAGMIRPLDPLLQGAPDFDLSIFYDGTVSAVRWQGQLWGLPADADPWMLYYNADLFDAGGLDYPTANWTWDDMLGAAQQLSDPEAESPVYGLFTSAERADFVSLVYQNGGTLVDSLVEPTTVTFTNPATVEAMELYVSLSLDQGVSPTPRDVSALGGFEPAVTGGHAAMWYGPLSDRGGASWGSDWPFNWGVVPPPGNVDRMTLITMRAYALNSATKQPAVAWEWMRYLAEHPATDRNVPPVRSVAESDAFRSGLREDVAAAAADGMVIGRTIPPASWIDDIAGWLGQALNSVYQGQMDMAAALQSVQEKADAMLAAQGSS